MHDTQIELREKLNVINRSYVVLDAWTPSQWVEDSPSCDYGHWHSGILSEQAEEVLPEDPQVPHSHGVTPPSTTRNSRKLSAQPHRLKSTYPVGLPSSHHVMCNLEATKQDTKIVLRAFLAQ